MEISRCSNLPHYSFSFLTGNYTLRSELRSSALRILGPMQVYSPLSRDQTCSEEPERVHKALGQTSSDSVSWDLASFGEEESQDTGISTFSNPVMNWLLFSWSPSNFLKITHSRLLTFASMDKQRNKIKNHDMNFMGLEKWLRGQECCRTMRTLV